MPEPNLNPAEKELEQALATLRPIPAGADEGQLMLRTGLAVGRRQAVRWRALAAGLLAALGVSVMWPAAPPPVERIVYVDRPAEVAPTHAAVAVASGNAVVPRFNYLILRKQVLERGLEAVDQPLFEGMSGSDVPRAGIVLKGT